MKIDLARRDFFRGRFTRPAEIRALRPPTAIAEARFLVACDGCLACVAACAEKVIRLDAAKRPVLQFLHGECTFCGDCADVCPTDALVREGAGAWAAKAEIGTKCLAIGGVHCRSCGDACPASALRFVPQVGGRYLPVVAQDACTGCGACVAVCPTGAVDVRVPEPREGVTA